MLKSNTQQLIAFFFEFTIILKNNYNLNHCLRDSYNQVFVLKRSGVISFIRH